MKKLTAEEILNKLDETYEKIAKEMIAWAKKNYKEKDVDKMLFDSDDVFAGFLDDYHLGKKEVEEVIKIAKELRGI